MKATSLILISVVLTAGTARAERIVLNCDNTDAQFSEVPAADCLSAHGISVKTDPPSTRFAIMDQRRLYEGKAAEASSFPNMLTQVNGGGPMFVYLRFSTPIRSLQFTRAKLLAGPSGITHPPWRAVAFQKDGARVAEVEEGRIASYVDVPGRTFTLAGDRIVDVTFSADNGNVDAFSSVLLDDLIIETIPVIVPPKEPPKEPAKEPERPPVQEIKARPIIAVFDIDLQGLKLDAQVRERLTVYLGTLLAAKSFRIVPRAQLKERLAEQKKDSYRACYEESCQIEIGKDLAAEKTVATQILRLGKQCKVAVTLFDLKRAASDGGATISGGCDEESVVRSLEKAIEELTKSPAR